MFSKSTPNLGLPLWQPKDHPDFLTDMNLANKKLDEEIGKNNQDFAHLQETVDAISTNMTTIEEEFAEIKQKVDDLENIEDNPIVKQLQADMTQAQTDITALKSAVETNTTNISLLTSRMSAVESDMDALQRTVASHSISITNLQDAIGALTSSVATMSTNITALETRMTVVELTANQNKTDIATANSSITNIEEDITEIRDKDTAQDGEIDEIKVRLSNVETSQGGDAGNITQLQTDVTELQGFKTTTENWINEYQPKIMANETDIESLTSDVDNLKPRVGSAETNIINLQTEYSQLDTRVETSEDNITKLNSILSKVIAYSSIDVRYNTTISNKEYYIVLSFHICGNLIYMGIANSNIDASVPTNVTLNYARRAPSSVFSQLYPNNNLEILDTFVTTMTAVTTTPATASNFRLVKTGEGNNLFTDFSLNLVRSDENVKYVTAISPRGGNLIAYFNLLTSN